VGLGAVSANANGFDLANQDAFAIARGMAFVATADNPSAIYYNPAGIGQLEGSNLRLGVYGFYVAPTYQRPSGGTTFENERKWDVVPQVYYTLGLDDSPVSFGLGFYSPLGLGLKWPQDTGFRTISTEASLTYFTINPVVALKVTPNFLIAAGITANYAEADLEQGLVWPTQDFDNFKFKGDGWNAGYNLGVLWKAHEKVSFGATFRGGTKTTLTGSTEYYNSRAFEAGPFFVPAFPTQHVDANADLTVPLQVVGGVSYRPTPKWNIEFNAEYVDWNNVTDLTIRQQHGFGGLLPQNVVVKLDWESSWYYELGVTHYFDDGWRVSMGYIFNENSVPDAHYTPAVADLDRHFFSAGVGYSNKRFDVDLAYQFGYGPARTVTGSAPSAIGQTADGKYDYISHLVALSVGTRF
jgi:long-chain fatty acid transport protein